MPRRQGGMGIGKNGEGGGSMHSGRYNLQRRETLPLLLRQILDNAATIPVSCREGLKSRQGASWQHMRPMPNGTKNAILITVGSTHIQRCTTHFDFCSCSNVVAAAVVLLRN